MMYGLRCATPMRALLRLGLHIEMLITCSIRLFLIKLVNHLMIALLALSPLSVAYALVVLLLSLTMNVLNNFFMRLIILFWDIKITVLEESVDFTTIDTEKLFSKLKSHELSRKSHPNYDASLTSKVFVTSTRVGGHVANPTNTTDSSDLEFALSSLCAASDKQYESIPNDEIALLARNFYALHRLSKERRRSPRGCFECGDTTHFIADCPKRKKFNSSNKYNYNNRNDSSDKGEGKKKYRFSDLDFSSDDSSSSEEDERPKRKTGNFTGLYLMGKASLHISDFDSNVSDDSSPESLSLRVVKLENAICNQDKLLGKVFHENKKLNLELESSFLRLLLFDPRTMI
jgi:hypothetical protein